MQVLNISFYLLCVKYSMLLISDVVVVVRSFIIYIFNLKLKHEALLWQKKRLAYHYWTGLQHLLRNKLHAQYFTGDKYIDIFNTHIYGSHVWISLEIGLCALDSNLWTWTAEGVQCIKRVRKRPDTEKRHTPMPAGQPHTKAPPGWPWVPLKFALNSPPYIANSSQVHHIVSNSI